MAEHIFLTYLQHKKNKTHLMKTTMGQPVKGYAYEACLEEGGGRERAPGETARRFINYVHRESACCAHSGQDW